MSEDVTIRRASRDADNPYRQIRRAVMEDESISIEARGVMGYVLVKPDDWQVQIGDLQRACLCGRDKIRRIIKELVVAGYMDRRERRDAQGQFAGFTILVSEVPTPKTENPSPVNSPETENPSPDYPATGHPATENPTLTNKEDSTNKESFTNEEEDEAADAAAPAPPAPAKSKGKGQKAEEPAASQHPAIVEYHRLYERFPTKAQMKIIEERDPPMKEWIRAIHEWAARDYNPTNIAGMLDWTFDPSLMERRRPNEKAKQPTTTQKSGPETDMRVAEAKAWAEQAYGNQAKSGGGV